MNERTIQKLFESYLTQNKIEYQKEFKTQEYRIDFRIRLGDKFCGVEAKSSKGNVFHTLGQLLLAKRTFSHIYLLAPDELISKIQDVVVDLGIGTITFKEGKFLFTKNPSPNVYYFNPPVKTNTPRFDKPKTKSMLIMDKDFFILTTFEGIVFNYLDVMKLFKTTRADAYARIKRLMKVGLLIEESSFNPKAYRVKKVVDWGTKFSLQ